MRFFVWLVLAMVYAYALPPAVKAETTWWLAWFGIAYVTGEIDHLIEKRWR